MREKIEENSGFLIALAYFACIIGGVSLLVYGGLQTVIHSILTSFGIDYRPVYSHLIAGVIALGYFIYGVRDAMFGTVSKDSLVRRVSMDEVRERMQLTDPEALYALKEWGNFIEKIEEDDEVWLWRTPAWTWKMLIGREGYVIVRRGEPTRHTITTGMN
jgi:hypothetical protein